MALSTAQKLRIREGDSLLTIHAPKTFKQSLGELPAAVKISSSSKTFNQVHWFVSNRAELENEVDHVLSLIKEGITCWIYYPKQSAGVKTDLTRDKGWDALLSHGDHLTWISLVSFDDTWSVFGCRQTTPADKARKAVPKDKPVLAYIDPVSKTVRVPDDLQSAFAAHKKEQALFDGLSYSNRKEWVEWIVSAKRDETRTSRVAGTIERLAKGWKNPQNN